MPSITIQIPQQHADEASRLSEFEEKMANDPDLYKKLVLMDRPRYMEIYLQRVLGRQTHNHIGKLNNMTTSRVSGLLKTIETRLKSQPRDLKFYVSFNAIEVDIDQHIELMIHGLTSPQSAKWLMKQLGKGKIAISHATAVDQERFRPALGKGAN